MEVIGSFDSQLCFCDCNINVDTALLSKGFVIQLFPTKF